ncbi:Transmembrane emp24 domain-containing protein 9 [Araneus ventricosus]|uniref:Transmembrane emp24 domain-containing protein 9 n=1 Tax=Araneus ventricosus TaxID=182803 RepID=A0A4Y2PRB7_ARAVE|nr:Transmembrane emp24 domain-containing protein 9 [Araneus ventricosus]
MLFLTVLLMVSKTEAFYFYLKEGDEKCFIRELPDKTLLIAHYRCRTFSKESEKEKNSVQVSSQENRMMVEVLNPRNKIVLSREYRSEGSFSITSHEPGEHTICMHTKDFKSSGRTLKIDLDIQVGEHTINYTAVAKKQKLSEMQTKLKQLNEKAAEIIKELNYQRYREEMFRESTETISRRILMWSVAQTVVLIMVGVWQVQSFRMFIESKKLV